MMGKIIDGVKESEIGCGGALILLLIFSMLGFLAIFEFGSLYLQVLAGCG